MKRIPKILIFSRLFIGCLILILAIINREDTKFWIFALTILGFLTDIFDGIIARKLNISTDNLRKLDSIIDRFFWMLILVSIYIMYPDFIKSVTAKIIILLLLELSVYSISVFRFKKIPSPHNIVSKVWGIFVLISFCDIILNGSSNVLFDIMIIIGIISRFDSFLIYSLIRTWDHDIPSFYHAYQLRLGNEIKRNDLFNG